MAEAEKVTLLVYLDTVVGMTVAYCGDIWQVLAGSRAVDTKAIVRSPSFSFLRLSSEGTVYVLMQILKFRSR